MLENSFNVMSQDDVRSIDEPTRITEAKITEFREPALHIAVGTTKAIHFVEKLVELMSTEALALQTSVGKTSLCIAATVGNIEAAAILVNKSRNLLYIRDNFGSLPLSAAENS
ncbi:hypothetical protein RJ639_038485 [Escallonia herrerae]|uniref:Uncharacterized protein n=1 Tax=Escallonia herrerae TaxID=1293975 RepID=A0AA88WKI0_9ASTE|nr:hypothetical protein RJ639_038485 [Escallonia herrerae]